MQSYGHVSHSTDRETEAEKKYAWLRSHTEVAWGNTGSHACVADVWTISPSLSQILWLVVLITCRSVNRSLCPLSQTWVESHWLWEYHLVHSTVLSSWEVMFSVTRWELGRSLIAVLNHRQTSPNMSPAAELLADGTSKMLRKTRVSILSSSYWTWQV